MGPSAAQAGRTASATVQAAGPSVGDHVARGPSSISENASRRRRSLALLLRVSDPGCAAAAVVRCNLPRERRSNLTMPRLALLSGVLAGSLLSALPASAATALQAGDASITQDESAGTWTIAAGGSSMTLALAPARDFNVVSLMSASRRNWALGTAPGTFVRVLNQSL